MAGGAGLLRSAWERFGRDEPYWGVCSQPEYRRARLDERALDAFLRSRAAGAGRLTIGAARPILRQ